MILQNNTNENTLTEINIQFINAIWELKVSTLLKQSNICKASRSRNGDGGKKRTAFETFQFLLMLLGWTDGYSFLPVAFNMPASANEEKRINHVNESIDKRTTGAKAREGAITKKPEAAATLIHSALETGIEASCVLMDTWFTNEPFIHAILKEGLDVIGMVKDTKQRYRYNGKLLSLKELVRYMQIDQAHNILGSVAVHTKKYNIAVKLVFVRNRNKKDEYIVLLSADCSLSASEIVRRYGNRRPILYELFTNITAFSLYIFLKKLV